MRIGIIGCGALGRHHAREFSRIEGVQVTAITDPDGARMDACAADLAGDIRRLADYRQLLDSRLDAVCIASPDALHVEQTVAALGAGLHVYCEKPLTHETSALRTIIAARNSSGKIVSLTYPRRYMGGMRALRREIQSGRWGPVTGVTAYNAEDWITPNVGTWRHDPALCPGGFFYDASGHQLDTVFWATGLGARWVRSSLSSRGTAVPIAAWGQAELSNGAPMVFSFAGDAHRWREQINIHCKGMDFALENCAVRWTPDGDLVPIEPLEPEESSEAAFVRLIEGSGPNWADPDDLWPVVRFTEAALESARSGKSVGIDRVYPSTVVVRDATADDLAGAFALRARVFMNELGRDREQETDEHDESAHHVAAILDGEVVGTLRLYLLNPDDSAIKIGRVAVRADLRNRGIGRRLMEHAHQWAAANGYPWCYLHAQAAVQNFYRALGYEGGSEVFMEAGAEHVLLRLPLHKNQRIRGGSSREENE